MMARNYNNESLHEDAVSITTNVDIGSASPPETNDQEWVKYDGLVDINIEDTVDELSEEASLSTDVEGGLETSNDDYSTKETNKSLERSSSIASDLLNSIRENKESTLDLRLERRALDFAFAQSERARGGTKPSGILNLVWALATIRADLQWVEEAAWRRENGKPYISWQDYECQRKLKRWKRPYLTYAVLIAHFCMMIYAFALSGWKPEPMKDNWSFGPPKDALIRAGGLVALDMAENGNYYRLVSATFLHAGVIHWFSNGFYIYVFGSVIEKNHGMACLSLVYFLPSVAAFVWSAWLNPGTVVGASGGVFGLLGACVADMIVNWNLMFLVFKDHAGRSDSCLKFKSFFWLVTDVAIHLIMGLLPYVDNFAHVGGFIYGFLAGFTVLERLPFAFFGSRNRFRQFRSFFCRFLAAAVMALAIAYSSVELSHSDGTTAPYPMINNHMNCVELPFWEEDKWWYCDQCAASQIAVDVFEMDDSNIFDRKIAKIELGCPDGSRAVEDISDLKLSALDDFSHSHLEEYCHKLC